MSNLELEYKHELMELMRGRGFKVQAHEDMISSFIPDLSFSGAGIDGWIEVKYCRKTPATLGSISHYTYGQQEWLTSRGAVGAGYCFLLVGTPIGNFMWGSGVLAVVRDLPWAEAIQLAWQEEKLGEIPKMLQLRRPTRGMTAINAIKQSWVKQS